MPTSFATRIDGLVLTPTGDVYAVPTGWDETERLAYLAGIATAQRDARLRAERAAFRHSVRRRERAAAWSEILTTAAAAFGFVAGLTLPFWIVATALELPL